MFDRGDRVLTPGGAGEVVSKRMGYPTYSEPESYSVLLDVKVEATKHPPFPSYSGTTYPAEQVVEEKSALKAEAAAEIVLELCSALSHVETDAWAKASETAYTLLHQIRSILKKD